MHQHLWLYRKLHIKKKHQPNISKLYSLLTQKLWQVAIPDIYSDTALTQPLWPPESANKAFHQTCWPACKCEFEPRFVSLVLLGWCPGRESRRTIPGRGEGLPIALEKKKKPVDHSSSSCTSPSLVPQKKPAATPPPPIVVLTALRIWDNTCHPQFYWSFLSLFALPAPIIQNNKMTLARHPEKEAWFVTAQKCEIMS